MKKLFVIVASVLTLLPLSVLADDIQPVPAPIEAADAPPVETTEALPIESAQLSSPFSVAVPTITPPLRSADILNYLQGRWSFESIFLNTWSKTSVKSEEIYTKVGTDSIEMQPVWAQDPAQSGAKKKRKTLRFTGLGGSIAIDMGDSIGPRSVTVNGNVYSFKPTDKSVMRMIILGKNRFIFEYEEYDEKGSVKSKQVSAYERIL